MDKTGYPHPQNYLRCFIILPFTIPIIIFHDYRYRADFLLVYDKHSQVSAQQIKRLYLVEQLGFYGPAVFCRCLGYLSNGDRLIV